MPRYDPEEFYRTTDMSLVTFLKMEGHTPQDILWEDPTCYWIFRITDSLLDAVDDYTEGAARVDPREYNREFSTTKREFYSRKDAPPSTTR